MSLLDSQDDFFNRKRPWSHIKDYVIGHYMRIYLPKLAKRGPKIVLVDAFAGPGVYENETGVISYGSPIVMCREAEKYANGRYIAFFGNRDPAHHQRLSEELRNMKIPPNKARAVLLKSDGLLGTVATHIGNETILLYLDPFGYKGCEFNNIQPFLTRPSTYSTEIILNLNVASLPRLAARHAVRENRISNRISANHQRLTAVLGGEWWKEILWEGSLSAEKQAWQVIKRYSAQFKEYFPYTGFCPVREKPRSKLKYFITFCSHHADALIAHNDNMCKAYNDYTLAAAWAGTMFEGALDWRTDPKRDLGRLDNLILDKVHEQNNRGIHSSRREVWLDIIKEPEYFMKWLESEYRSRVTQLLKTDLDFVDVRRTGRLNDDSLLYPKPTTKA